MSSLRPVTGSAEEILALLRAWDAADDPEPLVIATSGSTGEPKRVVLSRDAMRASAHATLARLGGPGQWALNLPPTYVAGLQVLYRSVVAAAHGASKRRYLSLVPTQLVRAMEEAEGAYRLREYDAVLVGGGPLDPVTRAEAERAGVAVVATYGMSETCGGCVYDGLPLDGVGVAIAADAEVLLRGPVLFDGYEDDPKRTAAAFDEGWFRTDDLGRVDESGRLHILGRRDDVVISGGVNVPAAAVATALRSHPAVTDVAVVGVPDREWGTRVVAVVVASSPVSLGELRDLVEPRAWAPRQLVTVAELPSLSNAKIDRAALRALAADG